MTNALLRPLSAACSLASVVLALMIAITPLAHAQTYTVLYAFQGDGVFDGSYPEGSLVFDQLGNLYGTTSSGGTSSLSGVVFKLDPSGNESIVHNFGAAGDGQDPQGKLVRVGGNTYGITQGGGKLGGTNCDFNECGTIWEISGGKEKVLYTFNSGQYSGPVDGLTADAAGNLYGVSPQSASGCQGQGVDCGIVYKVSQGQVSVIYTFGEKPDGSSPRSALVIDRAGNIYGTTGQGGTNGWGTVFELSPNTDGSWSEQVLYSFRGLSDGGDGAIPNALVMDLNGNLYGTTQWGGHFIRTSGCLNGCGVVFKLKHNANGTWSERVIHKFGVTADDGQVPGGQLVLDKHGILYGVTGQASASQGIVYKMDGSGNETILHAFAGGSDGATPGGGLIMDAAGNLYGTTSVGGVSAGGGFGTVFKITP